MMLWTIEISRAVNVLLQLLKTQLKKMKNKNLSDRRGKQRGLSCDSFASSAKEGALWQDMIIL